MSQSPSRTAETEPSSRHSGNPAAMARVAAVGRREWLLATLAGAGLWPMGLMAQAARPAPVAPLAPNAAWARIEAAARGQTVYFNAWAGSERINAYIQWAAGELQRQHGVRLEHVKISDAAEVVKRVRAEKAAARGDGSVDLVWINGENFLAMKREGLLRSPWAEALPAYAAVDVAGKPTTRLDFGEPVNGQEAPWGMAQLTFFAEGSRVSPPPASFDELAAWAQRNPGRFTYPRPPQFHGTTFLKQVLLESCTDPAQFYRPLDIARQGDLFKQATAPLWRRLDALHPSLWRQGRQFPANATVMKQMLADGELWISLTFNPNEVAGDIAARTLPASVVSYQHRGGTVGNSHFVAIPFNARAAAGAQVAADFLLSPAAQARKADIRHWGDPTVLALDRLSPAERSLFDAAAAPGLVKQPAPTLPEPHASWVEPLEREWLRRYSV